MRFNLHGWGQGCIFHLLPAGLLCRCVGEHPDCTAILSGTMEPPAADAATTSLPTIGSADPYGPLRRGVQKKEEKSQQQMKNSHSKGRAGEYLQKSPKRVNVGGASTMEWVNFLIDRSSHSAVKRMLDNMRKLRRACVLPDPDGIGCILTDVMGSDHKRTSGEAFRSAIDRLGELGKDVPVRVGVHVLAMIEAGKRVPNHPAPAHPGNRRNPGATSVWTCSHLCHNKSCTNAGHLCWEPNWQNRQRDGCGGPIVCRHQPRCIRAHRRDDQFPHWQDHVVTQE